MSDIQYPENGKKKVNLKTTDLCGNTTREEREVNIIQKLREGQYINIVESGDTATISADVSADYYNKYQINELFADLDTVKFKIVDELPAVGAENVIYLVAKTAPDTGYDQYIWDSHDGVFYPIGDTDIDLSDYYTKLQSDDRYYQKSEVYNKTETYSKTEADNKFLENLTVTEYTQDLYDNDRISKIDPDGKSAKNTPLSKVWEWILRHLTPATVSSITDTTNISGVEPNDSQVVKNYQGLSIWNYIKTKLTKETLTSVNDNTLMGTTDTSQANPVQQFTGLTLWNYIKSKFTSYKLPEVIDSTMLGTVRPNQTDPVQYVFASELFEYMADKMFPVGSIYTTISRHDPGDLFGGTWEHFGANRVLWGASSGEQAGEELSEQLPNIKGEYTLELTGNAGSNGAFRYTKEAGGRSPNWTGSNSWGKLTLDASQMTNSVYKDNGIVRPKAYTVHFWRRTA